MIVIQGPVMAYLSPRVSERPLVVIALLQNHDIVLVYAAVILFAVGNGIMWP